MILAAALLVGAVVMYAGSPEATPGSPARSDLEREAGLARSRLELPDAATELLAIVRYITALDGPLQVAPDTGPLSPWHERVLLKAMERLEVIDASVVEALLTGRLPTAWEFESMGGDTALRIYPALEGI